jgi:ribose transport system ATP-binding protein
MTVAPALEVSQLSKTFGGEQALRRVDLTIERGEVHGLLGHNGSGKSTLIKVLSGFHAPDPGGRVWIDGEEQRLPLHGSVSRDAGLSFVHQDLGLIEDLSICHNFRAGEFARHRRPVINWRYEAARTAEALAGFGLDVDPRRPLRVLAPAERAVLAIVRADQEMRARMSDDEAFPGILVLDEPTAFLGADESSRLFAAVRQFVERGASVLFVSHKLEEVLEITDRVTVLRDGAVAGHAATRDVTHQALVEMIVGGAVVTDSRPAPEAAGDDAVLATPDLAIDGAPEIPLTLRPGEIVGLTGLAGSGYREVLYALYGESPVPVSGHLLLGSGRRVSLAKWNSRRALAHNMALVPGDRLLQSGVAELNVGENVGISVLDRFSRGLIITRPRLAAASAAVLRQYSVQPARPDIGFGALSGGNQQKAVLAKWMRRAPAILMLDEPTQGVDIGARHQIYGFLKDAAAAGTAILIASTDDEQLADLCTRVLVFQDRHITAELAHGEVTKAMIARAVFAQGNGERSAG